MANNGGGTLGSNSSLSLPAGTQTDIQASDMNLDGKTDALVVQAVPEQILVLTNSGSGTFAQAAATVTGTSPLSVGAADLNIDGKQDLFCANLVDDTVMVFFSTLAATNVTATFQGTFNGSTLNVNGNLTLSGFPIITQSSAAPANNATLTPTTGYVKFAAVAAVSLNATTAIANGITPGAQLILEGGSDVNTVTIPNLANTRLTAAHTLGIRDTLTLLWNGFNWVELSYANN